MQTSETPNDEVLMERMAMGDQKAFAILYQRYWSKLCRFVRHYMNSTEDESKDVVQNVFVKVIQASDSFKPQFKFSTWIFTIAINTCKNEFRKEKRIQAFKGEIEKEIRSSVSADFLEDQEFSNALQSALQKLDENHRLAFVLRIQEELPVTEVARLLDCPEGTVKSRVYYALKKLSHVLQEFNPETI